jgi:hypothetical protein
LEIIYDLSLIEALAPGSYDKKLLAAPHPMLLLNLLDLLIVLSLSFWSSLIAIAVDFYAEIDTEPLADKIYPISCPEFFFKSMVLPKLAILLCLESLFKKYLLKDPFSYRIFRFY